MRNSASGGSPSHQIVDRVDELGAERSGPRLQRDVDRHRKRRVVVGELRRRGEVRSGRLPLLQDLPSKARPVVAAPTVVVWSVSFDEMSRMSSLLKGEVPRTGEHLAAGAGVALARGDALAARRAGTLHAVLLSQARQAVSVFAVRSMSDGHGKRGAGNEVLFDETVDADQGGALRNGELRRPWVGNALRHERQAGVRVRRKAGRQWARRGRRPRGLCAGRFPSATSGKIPAVAMRAK